MGLITLFLKPDIKNWKQCWKNSCCVIFHLLVLLWRIYFLRLAVISSVVILLGGWAQMFQRSLLPPSSLKMEWIMVHIFHSISPKMTVESVSPGSSWTWLNSPLSRMLLSFWTPISTIDNWNKFCRSWQYTVRLWVLMRTNV